MTEPGPDEAPLPPIRRYRPVLDFFGVGIMVAGALVITFGGLCLVGTWFMSGGSEGDLQTWLVPYSILAAGGLLIFGGKYVSSIANRLPKPKRNRSDV